MSTPENPELSNDLIRCKATIKPDCTVEISVTATRNLVETARKSALRSVMKSVTIPGFRKGKAPEHLVTDAYAGEIERSAKEFLPRLCYSECRKILNIPNLSSKDEFSYRILSFSEEEAKLTLSFETHPSVPSVDESLFSLSPITPLEVTEEKVAELLRQALFFYASWDSIEGRPVQEGDFLILNGDKIESKDETVPLFEGTRFEVTDASMAKWMKEAVLGKHAGETVEAVSVADENASEEEKALFQPASVRLTIQKIEKPNLPELTPELLKKMGAESEADLREKLEAQLRSQADRHLAEEEEKQAVEFLLGRHPFDIPKSYLNRELEFRSRQLAADAEFMKEWQTFNEPQRQKMIAFLQSQTEKSIRLSLLCSRLLQDAKVPLPAPETKNYGNFSRKLIEMAVDRLIKSAKAKISET